MVRVWWVQSQNSRDRLRFLGGYNAANVGVWGGGAAAEISSALVLLIAC
jgi:hypothetical protein